eukprot:3368131-Rhodomonas_salina.1
MTQRQTLTPTPPLIMMSNNHRGYTPKSKTRKDIPGSNCTGIAVSCVGCRGASAVAWQMHAGCVRSVLLCPHFRIQIPSSESRAWVCSSCSVVGHAPRLAALQGFVSLLAAVDA